MRKSPSAGSNVQLQDRVSASARWIAISVFVFASALNYGDRQILGTVAVVWRLHPEFPFTYADYGVLIERFSLIYAICAPFAGLFLDWIGLNAGISISVFLWSLISVLTGTIHNFRELLWCRTALGVAEAGGIAAFGKAAGTYLLPKERALGSAMSQVGLSIGSAAAPLLAAYLAWRHAFYLAGILGFVWIPVWLITARIIPASTTVLAEESHQSMTPREMLADKTFWALIAATFISMTFYSLWSNWTSTYLEHMHHLTAKQAANYAWAVPITGYLGAFLGGWLSWRSISKGIAPVEARKRVCLMAACAVLFSSGIPLLRTPLFATIGMSLSFFAIAAWGTNLYTLPIDVYGANRAAFGVSGLVFAYGLMQAVVSRKIGQIIEVHGFQPVLLTFALMPLIAYFFLRNFVHPPRSEPTASPANIAAST